MFDLEVVVLNDCVGLVGVLVPKMLVDRPEEQADASLRHPVVELSTPERAAHVVVGRPGERAYLERSFNFVCDRAALAQRSLRLLQHLGQQ